MYDCEAFADVNPFLVNVEQRVRDTGNGFTKKQGLFNLLGSQSAFAC